MEIKLFLDTYDAVEMDANYTFSVDISAQLDA
jgi:hypothetical protein